MRASEEVEGIETGEGWASKLADEAEAWRSRRSQAPQIARGGVQVVRLSKRSRSAGSNRVSAELSNT
jgi:hypothetical protein